MESAIVFVSYSPIGTFFEYVRVDIRPRKSATVTSVPYSASNLSNKGVKASTFMNMWKKPA